MSLKSVFFAVFGCLIFAGQAAALNVVASTAVLHSAVSAVMDGTGIPEVLMNPAVSVHDYALKPSDMRKLARADLLVWGGAELESFLPKTIEALNLTDKNVAVMNDKRVKLLPVRDGDGDEMDGHFWLMPENMGAVAHIVAERLAVLDAANADRYRENAEIYARRMRDLQRKGADLMGHYRGRPYVTFHDAYQYFEKSFGLTPLGSIFVDAHHAAGPVHMARLRETMKKAGTVCLFVEPQLPAKRALAVAENLSVVFGHADPAGAHLETGKEFYGRLMNDLFTAFMDCFGRMSERQEEK